MLPQLFGVASAVNARYLTIYGRHTPGFEPTLRLHSMGWDWRRLLHLWLEAEVGFPFFRGRGDVGGLFFAGIADDDNIDCGDGGGLVGV